jgi:phosphatidylglycerol---prolipoprotein diacylglyceryl transferase
MSFSGPFVHDVDPVIGTILGVHLWWYGLSYTLGFTNAHFFLNRRRRALGLSRAAVYDLTLLLVAGVLLGGRIVEVVFYEWPFYSENLHLIPAYWLGGMASHGLLLGGLAAVWIFCRIYDRPFLEVADALAVPAAFILGAGRIGNFIDGQILGSVTDVPWAVKFPDAEGFRHPVVLYDGVKNLLIIPILLVIGKRRLPAGVVTAIFLFLYAFLRIPVDVFREYPTSLLGLATGQALNLLMSVMGVGLIAFVYAVGPSKEFGGSSGIHDGHAEHVGWRSPIFVALLAFCLTIPSDWTQDIPARYGDRHSGLVYSAIYPRISAPD